LDIELETMLAKQQLHQNDPSLTTLRVDPDLRFNVSIHFTGDIQVLTALGFQMISITGQVAFGSINVGTLEKLNKHTDVISINKHRNSVIQLNSSVPDIMANNVWANNGDNFSGYTGKDVIIGIIDSGIDFRHLNFRKPDGTTRIKRIWDQTIIAPVNPPQAGEVPPNPIVASAIIPASLVAPLGYGVEYLENQINATLADETIAQPCRHVDTNSHGTHVAGIAAGNGKQAGGCHGEHTYIGVAPHADLIIVRLFGLTEGDDGSKMTPPQTISAPGNNATDAIKYILATAKTLGKPAVINCSFGFFSDQMDGTHTESTDINTILTANSAGNAIVIAAGNDGDKGFHAVGTVPASGSPVLSLELSIKASDNKFRSMVITYVGNNLEAQVVSPVGGANGSTGFATFGNSTNSSTANGTMTPGNPGSVMVTNSTNRISIAINPPNNAATPPVNGNNVANTATAKWRIELRNTTAAPTPFHAFCLFGSSHDPKSPKFLNNTTTNSTLTTVGTALECITVGSYTVGGQLVASSGRGPTLNVPARPFPDKPEICAPGDNIMSTAIPKERDGDTCANCCCQCCQDWYVAKGGTSMAAPHVTGVVALMLHKNPAMTHTAIKTNLIAHFNARPGDAPPGDIPGWGAGKVSALNSVSTTPVVNPPLAMVATQEDLQAPAFEQLMSTEYGPAYYTLGRKFFTEIWGLINSNKRVATAWHRSRGPVWTRMALTAFHNPHFTIPITSGGLHLTECVDRFLHALKAVASPELQVALETYRPHVQLVQDQMTMHELISVLGSEPLPAYENDFRSSPHSIMP
jgi:subtilisin family serine protease